MGQVQNDIYLCLVAVIGAKRADKSHLEMGSREREKLRTRVDTECSGELHVDCVDCD